jgi:putative ABC transport system permease protein
VELLLIASIGLAIGAITVVQFPLLELWDFMTYDVFAIGLAISLATIYGLTLICGFYPSWMATRVEPAEALHYE